MKVVIVFDAAAAEGAGVEDEPPSVPPDVAGVLESVDGVASALRTLGHEPVLVPAAPPLDGLSGRLAGADIVFNLAEGLGGQAEGEVAVARLLEGVGLPVTGARSGTLALCRRKDRVNALLEARELPVPTWALVPPGAGFEWTEFPAIVKPAGEDGSVGIGEDSVVDDVFELRALLGRFTDDAVVQRFLPGRELNVGFVGATTLPVAEIRFTGTQRVVSYAAKWEAGSVADRSTSPVCPARLPHDLEAHTLELASVAWSAVGGTGYGRVDLRTDEDGRPWVLEVNPNPDLAPGAGLARMARARGWDFTELVGRIVAEAHP